MQAVCIASGPSLTQEDVDYCRGKAKVYVVNDCYRMAPWADVLYACDLAWWEHHQPNFKGKKYTVDHEAAIRFGIEKVGMVPDAWSNQKNVIAHGCNSGFQVLNLAVIQGASRVILLGYDMKLAADKRRHWFGDHPGKMNKNSDYERWVMNFAMAAPEIPVPVINCTRESALTCFPKARLQDVL